MSISEKIRNEIVPQFLYNGTFIYEEPFGCGHINSTFAVYFSHETEPPVRYILQAAGVSGAGTALAGSIRKLPLSDPNPVR